MQSSIQIITTKKTTPSFLQAGCPSCRPSGPSVDANNLSAYLLLWDTSVVNNNYTVGCVQNCVDFVSVVIVDFQRYFVS